MVVEWEFRAAARLSEQGVEIRECTTVEELSGCVALQREVFTLPEVEISPVRHFVVTMHAGGFTLGAFREGRMLGFVLTVPAFVGGSKAYYSHMAAVTADSQGLGLGAALKWAQRERSLSEGIGYIKWTFQPVQARNAYFNLEKLGAVVAQYKADFYGIDYGAPPDLPSELGLESDRLIAEWHLRSPKAATLAAGEPFVETREPAERILTTNDWAAMVSKTPREAKLFQDRLREQLIDAFSRGLVSESFERGDEPAYLLYQSK